LKKVLLENPEQFINTVARKLMMYAVGRIVQYFDEPAIRAVVHGAAASNYTFESLVLGIVKSPSFQLREAAVRKAGREATAMLRRPQ